MKKTHPITVLAGRYPQLCLPIVQNARQTPAYRDSVLCGEPVNKKPAFHFSEEDRLSCEQTPVGEVEVLYLALREDFIHAYRALACRCEPAEIPDSVGAVTVSGLINWEKIHRHEAEYLAAGGKDWSTEFQDFTSVKSNYLDTIILLSSGNYSDVPAAKVGLSEQDWKEKSYIIRKFHELTHFVCRRQYPGDLDAIRDEVVADMIGLIKAFGEYDTGLAAAFLGIEGESYRKGGRLEYYAGNDLDGAIRQARREIDKYAALVRGQDTEDVFSLLFRVFRPEASPDAAGPDGR